MTAAELAVAPTALVDSGEPERVWLSSSDGLAELDVQRMQTSRRVPVAIGPISDFLRSGSGFVVAGTAEVSALDARGTMLWSRGSLTRPRVALLSQGTLGIVDERGTALAIRSLP